MPKSLVILAVFGALSHASAAAPQPGKLSKLEAKYSTAKSFSSKVKKTLKLKVLEHERSLEGFVKVEKPGKFRLEFTKPEPSVVVTDGTTIWMVTPPSDPDFDTTTRVLRSKNMERIQAQALVTFLLGKGGLLKEFSVTSSSRKGDVSTFMLKPKKKNEEIVKVELVVNEKSRELNSIRYWDSLENETKLEFSDFEFGRDIPDAEFGYVVPKDAEVTDL